MRLKTALRLLSLSLLLTSALYAHSTFAASADDVRAQIEAQKQKIAALEAEIAQYVGKLAEIGKNKSTIQSEITRLDTTRKKLSGDIKVTQGKISQATLEITRLSGEIEDRTERIELGRRAVASSLRTIHQYGDVTLLEKYYSANGLTDFWSDVDALAKLETNLSREALELVVQKAALTDTRTQTAAQKAQLSSLAIELNGQKNVLDQNRAEQATLLTQTKQSETAYQKLLREKQEAREQFEQELNQYESQLQYSLDPSRLPRAGRGVLSWPLDPDFMSRCASRQSTFKNLYCITQFYGHTDFARSGAYNGSQHNGVDFGSPTGTKVLAAQSGTVVATGNTDLYRGCYSYGKWVLVEHGNGLTTLYAHLSFVSVGHNDQVPLGGMLGYSGKTGYATGPHLHFTLFASDGVKLVRLGDIKPKTNCANATVPVAPTSAYLDPLDYL